MDLTYKINIVYFNKHWHLHRLLGKLITLYVASKNFVFHIVASRLFVIVLDPVPVIRAEMATVFLERLHGTICCHSLRSRAYVRRQFVIQMFAINKPFPTLFNSFAQVGCNTVLIGIDQVFSKPLIVRTGKSNPKQQLIW